MSNRFERNLYRAITGREPARAPRRKKSALHAGPARDPLYLEWLRTLRCCACGAAPRSEAAHTGRDGGTGIKASDYSAIPLCHLCHRTGMYCYHSGKQRFAAMHCLDYDALAERYRALWEKLQDVQVFGRRK